MYDRGIRGHPALRDTVVSTGGTGVELRVLNMAAAHG